jgi:hypothetical protein
MEGDLVSLEFLVDAHILKNQSSRNNSTQARNSNKHTFFRKEIGTQILHITCHIYLFWVTKSRVLQNT